MTDPVRTRKFAVLGFRAVGKSSLSHRFVEDEFVDSYNPTIENTLNATLSYKGQQYRIDIVDTAGQDEYSIFPSRMAVGIHGYIIVYSVASAKSLEVARVIHDKLLDATASTKVPLVLVGNKCDLASERVVSWNEGKKLADEFGCQFAEASAKHNQSVKNIFESLLFEVEKDDKAKGAPEKSDENCVIL